MPETLEQLAPHPTRKYGWRGRTLPGVRFPTADLTGLEEIVKPEVDPRGKMPPALDQGNLGSCTANATSRCFRYDSIIDGADSGELSRLWIYFFERMLEGTLSQGDCGAWGHDAFRVAHHGIPDESLYPYDIGQFEIKPPDVEPRAYTLTKAINETPQTEDALKQVLSNDQTVAIGFTVYESFEASWEQPGVMPEPKQGENILGGHEVLVCGYLEAYPDHFLTLNSWGTGWGLDGYFLFPKATLLDPETCSDFRTIVRPLS